ncbi:MAG: hypothetical protein LBF26_03055 [Puniceicoccales bacterium]|jgi:hypothetical protein|nr:hypothetical protein [Puniceicoccales bacterium]
MSLALVPDSATLALIREGFANERKTLETYRSKCTDLAMMRFHTERIAMLWSAEAMGCVLMAIAGKFEWECVHNLEAALYLCMVSPDRDAMAKSWEKVLAAFQEVSSELRKRSAEQLEQERARTRKAKAEAVTAERQTHNWLWRVFH